MEWAEIVMERVVEESVVDGEEDCPFLCLWCLFKEG
jgi:hypothetical protein